MTLDIGSLLTRQGLLLILIAIGYIAARTRIVDEKGVSSLSRLAMNVCLPCSIITSALVESDDPSLMSNFLVVLAIGFAAETAVFLICRLLFRRKPTGENAVLSVAMLCPNAAFVGLPIIEALFGGTGVFYMSAMVMAVNFMMWSFGMTFYVNKPVKETLKIILKKPLIPAILISFVIASTGLRLPAIAESTLNAVGGATTFLCMVSIGALLAGVKLSSVFTGASLRFCLVRLVATPLVMLGIMCLIKPEPVVSAICVISMGLCAGPGVAVAAGEYGYDNVFASKLVFSSTLLSSVTIPLLALAVSAVMGA